MSINQRIDKLEKFYKKRGITFHKYINVNPQTIKNITGERKSNPSHKILESILRSDSNININWLILGEGEMWLDSKNSKDKEFDLKEAIRSMYNEMNSFRDTISEIHRRERELYIAIIKLTSTVKGKELDEVMEIVEDIRQSEIKKSDERKKKLLEGI